MNKISILAPHEAQKIAAGEVVERPSHIIKELFENAIDAQATSITLRCTQAGKKNIVIADDGSGMTPDDAKLCVQPHATSKIKTLDDVTSIHSFGFRGEALASISAVSKVTITTRQKSADVGTQISFENGEVVEEKEVSCPHGTSIEVDDLFYNTPVRRKFLKRDETEWNQIMNLVQAFCLNDLNLSVTIFHNDKLVLNAPAVKNLRDRVAQLWDHNVAQNMLELHGSSFMPFDKLRMNDDSPAHPHVSQGSTCNSSETVHPECRAKHGVSRDGGQLRMNSDSLRSIGAFHPEEHAKGVRLEGLISNHHFWRYNRQQIFFFVNGRYVKMGELSKALLKGYRNVLPPARFPAVFLFITVDPNEVDINVHPKKEEVRFVKPGRVARQLQEAVSRTLEGNVSKQLDPFDPITGVITSPYAQASEDRQGERSRENISNSQTFVLPTGHSTGDGMSDLPSSIRSLRDHSHLRQGYDAQAERTGQIVSKHKGQPRSPGDLPNDFMSLPKKMPSGLSELAAQDFTSTQKSRGISQNIIAHGSAIEDRTPWGSTAQVKATHSNQIIHPSVFAQATTDREPRTCPPEPWRRPGRRILTQLFATYILIEKENELIMIDQHAAHERILYEKWMTKFTKKEGTMLMFPLTITLDPHEIDQILTEEQFFADQGIGLRRSGNDTLSVISSPAGIADNNLEELIRDAVAFIHEHEELEKELFRKKLNEHVHSHLACKMAVKAGDTLEVEKMEQLVTDLMEVDNRFICVHGRPTMWTISKAEIEKKFRRRGP